MSTNSERPRHAGFWVRFAAVLLDMVVLGIPLRVVLLVLAVFGSDAGEVLVQLVLLTIITVLLWVNWDGRTPGKKMLRIRIVSYPNYQPFAYRTESIRTLASLLGVFTLGLGYLAQAVMIAAREDKRGYHDLAAGTCVVHDR